jgi:hypothetical protein
MGCCDSTCDSTPQFVQKGQVELQNVTATPCKHCLTHSAAMRNYTDYMANYICYYARTWYILHPDAGEQGQIGPRGDSGDWCGKSGTPGFLGSNNVLGCHGPYGPPGDPRCNHPQPDVMIEWRIDRLAVPFAVLNKSHPSGNALSQEEEEAAQASKTETKESKTEAKKNKEGNQCRSCVMSVPCARVSRLE